MIVLPATAHASMAYILTVAGITWYRREDSSRGAPNAAVPDDQNAAAGKHIRGALVGRDPGER
jgi:hypothetical protein